MFIKFKHFIKYEHPMSIIWVNKEEKLNYFSKSSQEQFKCAFIFSNILYLGSLLPCSYLAQACLVIESISAICCCVMERDSLKAFKFSLNCKISTSFQRKRLTCNSKWFTIRSVIQNELQEQAYPKTIKIKSRQFDYSIVLYFWIP